MEKIDFEDIRVGDRIRVTNREEYANGDFDTETTEITVIDKTPTCADGTFHSIYNVWSTITLLDRPKPTFKVGDTITGEQVADLPDGAVLDLNDGCVDLRYKIDGELFSAQGYIAYLDTLRESDYRDIKIVFLPEA